MELGVQYVVREARALEQTRQRLGCVDARRADEHREAEPVQTPRFLDDAVVLLTPRLVDEVLTVVARNRAVGRNDRDLEPVDLKELAFFRLRRTGHAGELLKETEIILNGDGRERLRLTADLHVLLGFHRLVQTFAPAAASQRAPGKLIDDDDFAVAHDVFLIAQKQSMRAQGGV